jgi:hypothetical protein
VIQTVTKETFDIDSYAPLLYSRDSVRAMELWKTSAAVPLPVMIRYLGRIHGDASPVDANVAQTAE